MKRTLYMLLALLPLLVACGQRKPATTLPEASTEARSAANTHIHIPAPAVEEPVEPATCQSGGRLDEVVRCSVCGLELERVQRSTAPLSHRFQNGACLSCGELKGSEGLKFVSNGDGTCSVAGMGSCKDEHLVIPALSPAGDRVTAIRAKAFYHRAELLSVRIANGVEEIGNEAFAYCANLRVLTLPNGLTSWGDSVLADCDLMQLQSDGGCLYVGSQNNPHMVLLKAEDPQRSSYEPHANTLFLSNHAFANCDALVSLSLPNRVRSVGGHAFQGCDALETVQLPDGLTAIADGTFQSCPKLTAVTLPSGVTSVGSMAFAFCGQLEKLVLSERLQYVGSSAFYFCKSLTELAFPEGLNALGDGALENCERLTRVLLPASLQQIGRYCFKGCNALTEVRFAVTSGWLCKGVTTSASVDVSNPSANVKLLRETNADRLWFRG